MQRFTNTKKNVLLAIVFQILSLFSGFIIRKLLVDNIGMYLIGVNGVYENIISMLCLCNFGIGPASLYFLYRSFSKDDIDSASRYYQAFTRLFRYVSLAVIIIGALLTIKINWIINIEYGNITFLRFFFVVHLLKAVSNFLITVPRYALQCDEKRYYSLLADSVSLVVFAIIKGYCLITYHNLIQYLALSIVESLVSNGYIYYCLRKQYCKRGFFIKHEISSEVRDILLYSKHLAVKNINDFVNNCTDNIVISKICGEITVGFMSNYYLITNAIVGFTSQVFSSVEATFIRSFNLAESYKDEKTTYHMEMVLSYVIASFVSIFLYALTDMFIRFYFGPEYSMGNSISLLMTISVALSIYQYPSCHYLSAKGMNNLVVKTSTAMVISNIVFSVILAMIIGEKGVLIGTIIANAIMFIGQDVVTFKNSDMFDKSLAIEKTIHIVLSIIQFVVILFILPSENTFYALLTMWFKCLFVWIIFIIPYAKDLLALIKGMITF